MKEKLIENRKDFWIGVSLLLFTVIIVLPFPHHRGLGETILLAVGIPPYSNMETHSGFHFVGILTLIMVITGLYYFSKGLSKWRGRLILLILFVILPTLPMMIVETIQATVAKGVYAVAYDSSESTCNYLLKEYMMEAEMTCYLPLKNHQNKDVDLEIVFVEPWHHDVELYALLNSSGPHYVTLRPKETRVIIIHEILDLSNEETYYHGYNARNIDIILRDHDGNERRL